MGRRFLSVWAVPLSLALLAVSIGGCAPAPPDREPDIRGVVESVNQADGVGSTFLVSGTGAYDKASVSVDAETRILTPDGDAFTESDSVEVGDNVEVWFTGAVAESYPVQAKAETVVVRP